MAIEFIGSTSANSSNGGDVTLDLTLITGLATDDLVIVAYAVGSSGDGDYNMAVSSPTGYTEVADLFADDTQDAQLGVFYKKQLASVDTSVVVSGFGNMNNSAAAVAMAFRGVDTTTPMDVTPTTVTGVNTMHPNPPSINHNNPAGVWTVIAGASGHTINGLNSSYTFPTGYTTDGISAGGNDTDDCNVGMGYRSSGVSDPEDPGVMTLSGTDDTAFCWAACTIALRPAVAAPVTHTATGAVAAQSATATGAAKRFLSHDATGAVSAQSATTSGTASRTGGAVTHDATGGVVSGSATASGTAKRYLTHDATGAVVAQSSTATGAAAGPGPLTHVATGSVSASAATTTGAAQRNSTHVATGTVTADSSTVSGSASRVVVVAHDATGAVIAQSASVSGEADNNYEEAPKKNKVAIVGHINKHTRDKFQQRAIARSAQTSRQRVARKASIQKREIQKAVGILSGDWNDVVPVRRGELKVPLMQVEFKQLNFDTDDELEAFH